MNLEKLRKLTQEGQNNLEKEVLKYCNPQNVAKKLMQKLEIIATKAAEAGKREAEAFISLYCETKMSDGWRKANEQIFSKLDSQKSAELTKILFEMVKKNVSDDNIQWGLLIVDDLCCEFPTIQRGIFAKLSW